MLLRTRLSLIQGAGLYLPPPTAYVPQILVPLGQQQWQTQRLQLAPCTAVTDRLLTLVLACGPPLCVSHSGLLVWVQGPPTLGRQQKQAPPGSSWRCTPPWPKGPSPLSWCVGSASGGCPPTLPPAPMFWCGPGIWSPSEHRPARSCWSRRSCCSA